MRDGVERPQDWHRRFVCIFRPPLQCLSSNAVAAAVKMRHRGPWSSTASVSPSLKSYGSGRLLASVFPHRRRSKAKFELQLAEQFGFIDFAGGAARSIFTAPGRSGTAQAGAALLFLVVTRVHVKRPVKKRRTLRSRQSTQDDKKSRSAAAQRKGQKKWSATTARRSSEGAPTEVQ